MASSRQVKTSDRVKVTVYAAPEQLVVCRDRAAALGVTVSKYLLDLGCGVLPERVDARVFGRELMAIRRELVGVRDAGFPSSSLGPLLARLDWMLGDDPL